MNNLVDKNLVESFTIEDGVLKKKIHSGFSIWTANANGSTEFFPVEFNKLLPHYSQASRLGDDTIKDQKDLLVRLDEFRDLKIRR